MAKLVITENMTPVSVFTLPPGTWFKCPDTESVCIYVVSYKDKPRNTVAVCFDLRGLGYPPSVTTFGGGKFLVKPIKPPKSIQLTL